MANRFLRLLTILSVLLALPAAKAAADVTVDFSAGVLTLTADSGSSITVTAAPGGFVEVNTSPTLVLAADVLELFVVGDAQPNILDLSAVSAANFPNTAFTHISGGPGADLITGSALNDTIIGGPGPDTVFMGPGADTFIWNNGDGTDDVDGGAGPDEVIVNGSPGAGDAFVVRASGTDAELARTNFGFFSVFMENVQTLTVNGLGGNDSLESQSTAGTSLNTVHFDGGDGLDTLTVNGSADDDTFALGGNGAVSTITADLPDARNLTVQGVEVLNGAFGDGNDSLTVSDLVGSGFQTLLFDGEGGANDFTFIGGADAEQLQLNDAGGAQVIRLTPTPLELQASNFQTVTFNGGPGADDMTITGDFTASGVTSLTVLGGTGDDTIDASGASSPLVVVWNNGDNTDTVTGGTAEDTQIINGAAAGDEFIIGEVAGLATFTRINLIPFSVTMDAIEALVVNSGDGNDSGTVTSLASTTLQKIDFTLGTGADNVDGSAGDIPMDFHWFNGDGTDLILGGSALDRQFVETGNANETFTLSPVGSLAVYARTSAGPFSISMNGVDELHSSTLNGDDSTTVAAMADFTPTGLARVHYTGGRGDDSFDANGSNLSCTFYWDRLDGNDTNRGGTGEDWQVFSGNGSPDTMALIAVGATARIARTNNPMGRADTLDVEHFVINNDAGVDTVNIGDMTGTAARTATIDSGPGNDIVNAGGTNIDVTFIWNNGDNSDTITTGSGNDRLIVNGAQAGNQFRLEQAGGAAVIARQNLIPFSITATGVETLEINTFGGDDYFEFRDVSGTSLTMIELDAGGGDDLCFATASATTGYFLDGGPHNAGDTLAYITGGAAVTLNPGEIAVDGAQSIFHQNWENFTELESFPDELWSLF